MFRLFTQNNGHVFYVLDPATKRGGIGCHLTHRIHNIVDELEAAKIEKRYKQCNRYDHTCKKCHMNE
jgi:hypothetical protein